MPTNDPSSIEALALMEGGPGARVLKKLHLLVTPEMGKVVARPAVIFGLLAWLPLLLLTFAEHLLFAGARIPFADDIAVHTRFLFAVPVLLFAEIPIGRKLRQTTSYLISSGVVPERESAAFRSIIASTVAMRDSRVAEGIVLAFAYFGTFLSFSGRIRSGSTWFEPGGAAAHFSIAGYWYILFAIPLFQFLIFRWIYRLFVWGWFLNKVTRLNLRLSATHPDGAAGLAFLGRTLVPFSRHVRLEQRSVRINCHPRDFYPGRPLLFRSELPGAHHSYFAPDGRTACAARATL
jgi:hypothetical protein